MPAYLKGHAQRGKNWSLFRPPDAPTGICECGCGHRTPTCSFTRTDRRHYIGHPLPLIPGHKRPEPTDSITTLTPEQAAYLAGIIDGEGCVHMLKAPARNVRVSVANTDVLLMDWLRRIGGSVITNSHGRPNQISQKSVHSWSVSSWRTCRDVLRQTVPFMIIKKQRSELALTAVTRWLTDKEARRKPQPKGATRPRKYHTDEARRIAGRDRQRRYRERSQYLRPRETSKRGDGPGASHVSVKA